MPISPGVYTKIIDLSDYVRSVPGTFGFIALVSEKGPDNRLVLTNARDFYLDFGEPNINYLGTVGLQYCQGKYVASSFLTQSDNLYVIRVTPESAAYSNLVVAIDVTKESEISSKINSIPNKFLLVEKDELDLSDLTSLYEGEGIVIPDTTELDYSWVTDATIKEKIELIENTLKNYYNYEVILVKNGAKNLPFSSIQKIIYNRLNKIIKDDTNLSNWIRVGYIDNLNTYAEINTLIDGNTKLSYNPSTGKFQFDNNSGKYMALMVFYGVGRGEWYNNFKIKIYPHPNPIKMAEGIYVLDVYQRQKEKEYNEISKNWEYSYEVAQSFDISFKHGKLDLDNDSMFISDVVNKYYRYLDSDYTVNTQKINDFAELTLKLTSTLTKTYNLFNYSNKKFKLSLDNDSNVIVNPLSPLKPEEGTETIWKQNTATENVDIYIKYNFNFAGVFDPISEQFVQPVQLGGGDDGFPEDDNTYIANKIKELLIRAYTGRLIKTQKIVNEYNSQFDSNKYLDDVLNTDTFFFNVVLDAGYPSEVKDAIVELCRDLRQDCVAILDNGDNYSIEKSIEKRTTENNFNTYYAAIYEPFTMIYDKFTGKDIWITPVYHIAKILPYTENVSEPWTAPAGFNRATIDTIKAMRFNPRQGDREQLYLRQINPIVTFSNGTVVWGQLTTLFKVSALQDLNIVRLLLYIRKGLELYCRNYIFESNDADTWNNIRRDIEEYMEDIKNRRGVYSYDLDVGATELEIKSKKIHVNLKVVPTRVAEQINLSFMIE